jgi:glycosyltransferase 2 family protein
MKEKKCWVKYANILIFLVILVFIIKLVYGQWDRIKNFNFKLDPLLIVLSFLMFAASVLIQSYGWNKILKIIERKTGLSHFEALKIVVYSRFGKYLPGSIWAVLGRAYFGNKSGISSADLILSSVAETVIGGIGILIVSLILLASSFGTYYPFFYLAIPSGLALVYLITHKHFINAMIELMGAFSVRLKGYLKEINSRLGEKDIFKLALIIIFSQLIASAGFFVFLLSIGVLGSSFVNFFGITGAYLFAGIIGTLVLFVPAGLGVREGLLALLLSFYIIPYLAVFASISARLWIIANEAILFCLVYIINYILSNPKYENTGNPHRP